VVAGPAVVAGEVGGGGTVVVGEEVDPHEVRTPTTRRRRIRRIRAAYRPYRPIPTDQQPPEFLRPDPYPADPVSVDEQRAVAFDHLAPPERQHPGHELEGRPQPGDLGEDPLRAPHHPPRSDIVFRSVPGADETTIAGDTAVGQIGGEMAAPACHGEQFAIGVSGRVATGSLHRPGRQLGCLTNLGLGHSARLSSGR